MKKILGLVFLVLLLTSAVTLTDNPPQDKPSIEGTWELVNFYNYDDDGSIADTVPTTEGYRQIKMYYDGKVMWTRYVPTDSVEWFGYGSYRITDTTLTENLEYMSASMLRSANELREWKMKLELKEDTYSQIFTDADGNRTFSENYKRLN